MSSKIKIEIDILIYNEVLSACNMHLGNYNQFYHNAAPCERAYWERRVNDITRAIEELELSYHAFLDGK